ncbi:MAG: nicotinamidase [Chloroflexota bacterium]
MTFPDFYNAARVGELYTPDVPAATAAGSRAGLGPAAEDSKRTMLLLIDVQVDFAHPSGSLFVPGAVEDTQHTIEWIYNNAESITSIAASLDSHTPIQIFHPLWWADADGNHPAPYTVVSADEVAAGTWKPLYEKAWSTQYVRALEEDAKKQLMIWPFHTLIGTPGHNLMPALYEAIAFHSAARQAEPQMITKGTIPKTEYYSMLEPEVKIPDHPLGTINREFVDDLATYDRIYITGQAKSHCVLETTSSLVKYFSDRPDILQRIHLLKDFTSSVVHPEIDFDAIAEDAIAGFEQKGVQVVTTA